MTMRTCSGRGCQEQLPRRVNGKKGRVLCLVCQRVYMRGLRQRQRESLSVSADTERRYCSTCGVQVGLGLECCERSILIPAVPWSLWSPEQTEFGLTLKWCPGDGVMTVEEMTLKTGATVRRVLDCGSKLWTPDGALKSPYLYTSNTLGTLLFLTPRSRDGRY